LQSRYVGAYLLYGAGTGWRRPQATPQSQIYAVRYATGDTYEVPLVHAVDRIEALGSNAVAVGSDGKDLHMTSLRLARFPVAVDRYTQPNAAQGETRSHGFYYKPESEHAGLLGLPIINGNEAASRQLRKTSAALLYLRANGLRFSELGTLDARPGTGDRDDGCRASCVDWYGNSRPLFLRGRVFALMGYELAEGSVTERSIVETRRINFAPSLEIAHAR
ncbi:MAG: beta-propeller domain-containing protein, partial [Burkholderiaceae bacterium]